MEICRHSDTVYWYQEDFTELGNCLGVEQEYTVNVKKAVNNNNV